MWCDLLLIQLIKLLILIFSLATLKTLLAEIREQNEHTLFCKNRNVVILDNIELCDSHMMKHVRMYACVHVYIMHVCMCDMRAMRAMRVMRAMRAMYACMHVCI